LEPIGQGKSYTIRVFPSGDTSRKLVNGLKEKEELCKGSTLRGMEMQKETVKANQLTIHDDAGRIDPLRWAPERKKSIPLELLVRPRKWGGVAGKHVPPWADREKEYRWRLRRRGSGG